MHIFILFKSNDKIDAMQCHTIQMDMTSSFQQYLHETGIGETLKESDMRANRGDPDGYGASGTNMDHKLHKEDVPMFTLDKVIEFKKNPEKKK